MSGYQVLVVDDDDGIRFGLKSYLESHGCQVTEAERVSTTLEAAPRAAYDLAIIDYLLPDGNALTLLPKLKELQPAMPVMILTGHGSIELAVQAIKLGAEQFVTKPVELASLWAIAERMLETARLRRAQLAGTAKQRAGAIDPFFGASPAIATLRAQAERIAASDSPVLLQGETGVGKGVLATWIDQHSPRASEAFVDLNCAGLATDLLETELFGHKKGAFTSAVENKPGLFEAAHRGTLFLDEVGDIATSIQPKLLKVLEEQRFRRLGEVCDRQVDVRLIAATNQQLDRLVATGSIRSDFYYRVSTFPLRIPALRERREDIPLLSDLFLRRFGQELRHGPTLRFSPAAMDLMCTYHWPGNIRELRNVVERAVMLGTTAELGPADLAFHGSASTGAEPSNAQPAAGIPEAGSSTFLPLEAAERQHIEQAIALAKGKASRAAELLGIQRSSFYAKVKRHGIELGKS